MGFFAKNNGVTEFGKPAEKRKEPCGGAYMGIENRKTILIVDDTTEDIDILVNMLSDDYQVKVALNGQKALHFLGEKNLPDLVLLDILMPGIDGYKVCEAIKSNDILKDIPVIFISALDQLNDIISGFKAGGVDYITKPFQPEEVRARVDAHIKLRDYHQQLKEKNTQLEENFRALQELEQQRDSLTHMIVHDMRAPIQTIMGYLELLKYNEHLSEDDSMYVHKIQECCGGLTEMVNSLLDISRLENNKIPLLSEEIDLEELIEKVVSGFSGVANAPRIITDLAPCPEKLDADRSLIERVMINLLSNACKFTPGNGLVTVSMNRSAKGFIIKVTDTGEGIPPEEHDRIFEKFAQVMLSRKRYRYSSGLGLTFCKLAVEAHGGKISVKSAPGKGSVFTVELPPNQKGRNN
jgi:signal transduction histidine kinase